MKAFLTGCIPELHSQALIFNVDGFGDEIDTDCGLDKGARTC